jgi:hypothetical protein
MLLLSQQLGWAHVASHIGGLAQQSKVSVQAVDQTLTQGIGCEQCLAFAQLASALPFDVPKLPTASAPQLPPFDLTCAGISLPIERLYQARAPPAFS